MSKGSVGNVDRHHAYILRFWQEDQNAPWRIYLKDVTSDKYLTFLGLESLVAYLLTQLSDSNDSQGTNNREVDR